MYSLNVPVPGEVALLASDLARDLPDAYPRQRDEHTLCLKRLHVREEHQYDHVTASIREELAGQQSFDVEVTHLDYFPEAINGSSPVVYLCVESDELVSIHRRLASVFECDPEVEGAGYTPHVTVARGGSFDAARTIVDREIHPISWTVSKLVFWDATRKRRRSSITLGE